MYKRYRTLSSPAYVCRVDDYIKCTHTLLCRWSVMPAHKPVVFPLCYGNTARKQKDFLHRNCLRLLRDAHLYTLALPSRHTGASCTVFEETRSTPYNLDLNPQTHTTAKKSKSSCVHSVRAQTKTPHVVAFWVKHLLY